LDVLSLDFLALGGLKCTAYMEPSLYREPSWSTMSKNGQNVLGVKCESDETSRERSVLSRAQSVHEPSSVLVMLVLMCVCD